MFCLWLICLRHQLIICHNFFSYEILPTLEGKVVMGKKLML